MSFLDLPAPHGLLEALYWKAEDAHAAAVVCHPHPQHGGTMHNHVTYRLAQALREAKVSALRFNFRGVGRSTGVYDHGEGELADAGTALDYLAANEPEVPLWAAGFSFGARVALRLAAQDARVEKVLATGLAVDLYDFEFLTQLHKPKAIVHAEHDEYGGLAKVEALVKRLPGPTKLFVVPDCDHLATGRLDAFLEVARKAVDWLQVDPADLVVPES
ncbi:MAG: alpha/beta hydrolase [Myxococcota bacterium]